MIVEDLKTIATTLGWHFNYGADHWQNLKDYESDQQLAFADRNKFFLLLWKDRAKSFDEFGTQNKLSFNGEFVFAIKSDLDDEDYNSKYDVHIKNLEVELEKLTDNVLVCGKFQFKDWKDSEVSNVYDANLDGLKVRFTISYD